MMTAARTLCPQHRVLFDAYQVALLTRVLSLCGLLQSFCGLCEAIFGEDRSRGMAAKWSPNQRQTSAWKICPGLPVAPLPPDTFRLRRFHA